MIIHQAFNEGIINTKIKFLDFSYGQTFNT